MVERDGQLDDPVPEADAFRALGDGAEEDLGSGGVTVFLEEMVFDLPHVVDAETVGQLDLFERVLQQPVLVVHRPRARQLVFVEDPEPHATSPRTGARSIMHAMPLAAAKPWWHGVLYHVYLRSFADSDSDGAGDLQGLISKLDHLAWLGVDGIWVSPVMPSPNEDWGYDVADYCAVDPAYGSLSDVDELVARASAYGIRVLFDLVPNHTSDRHSWFTASRSSREDPKRDW